MLPAAEILAPLGFAISGLIILWSGWDTDWKLGIAILIGYVILAANLIFKLNDKPVHLNLKGAAWLPVYLVGMGIIIYVSSFGPLDDPVLGDYLGILVTVHLQRCSSTTGRWPSRCRSEEIEEMVSEVVLPEEEGLEHAARLSGPFWTMPRSRDRGRAVLGSRVSGRG